MYGGFSDQNRNRDYPLLYGTSGGLRTNNCLWALVDARISYRLLNSSDRELATAKLETISVSGGTVKFKFGLYLPYNLTNPIYITVTYPSNPTLYSVVNLTDTSKVTIDGNGNEVAVVQSIFGYIVFSKPDNPQQVLSTMSIGAELEPTCVTAASGTGVFTCSVGNANRTRATLPIGCPDEDILYEQDLDWGQMDPDRAFWKQPYDGQDDESRIISGRPIILREGMNCQLSVNTQTNTITITSQKGSGMSLAEYEATIPDEDKGKGIPLGFYSDNGTIIQERTPEGRTRYDGAVRPEETIRRIESTTGGRVSIIANHGVTIVNRPLEHTIYISATGVERSGC